MAHACGFHGVLRATNNQRQHPVRADGRPTHSELPLRQDAPAESSNLRLDLKLQ
jgi:hypothetical protein